MKTDPIRSKRELKKLEYYFEKKENMRDLAIVVTGVNTALRCSDMLSLKWGDVYDFDRKKFKSHICIIEKKTKKEAKIKINNALKECLKKYFMSLDKLNKGTVLFKSRKGNNKAISRIQMYRILKNAAQVLKINGNIGCHSLRKTFGYNAYKSGASAVILMELFNHSSFYMTRRYIGIDQDEKDRVLMKLNL